MAKKVRAECFVQIAGRHIRRRISFAVNAVIKSENGKLCVRLVGTKTRREINFAHLAERNYNTVKAGEHFYEV